jgi:hypothetical protein
MAKLAGGRLLGRFLAAPWDKLRELAGKLQVRHLANVVCAAGSRFRLSSARTSLRGRMLHIEAAYLI